MQTLTGKESTEPCIERWRQDVLGASLPDDLGLTARVYLACSQLYQKILDRLKDRTDIDQPVYYKIQRSFSTLVLWAKNYEASNGTLDEVLIRSPDLRTLTLNFLTSIGRILAQRLVEVGGLSLDRDISVLSSSIRDLVHEWFKQLLNHGYSPNTDHDENSIFPEDTLERIAANLRTKVDCLIDLGPLIQDLIQHHQNHKSRTVNANAPNAPNASNINTNRYGNGNGNGISVPRLRPVEPRSFDEEAKAHCKTIRDRFPKLPLYLVERLGGANAQRVILIKKRRDEQTEHTPTEKINNLMLSPTGSRFPDMTRPRAGSSSSAYSSMLSGHSRGNSNASRPPSRTSFSTAQSSFDHGDVRIPPLPKGASDGRPIDCPTCSRRVLGVTDSAAWRTHLYGDILPYVCTAESCNQAHILFGSLTDWAKHEEEHHGSRKNFCPFCAGGPTSGGKTGYYHHLSRHLETISIAVIPRACDSSDGDAGTEDTTSSSSDVLSHSMAPSSWTPINRVRHDGLYRLSSNQKHGRDSHLASENTPQTKSDVPRSVHPAPFKPIAMKEEVPDTSHRPHKSLKRADDANERRHSSAKSRPLSIASLLTTDESPEPSETPRKRLHMEESRDQKPQPQPPPPPPPLTNSSGPLQQTPQEPTRRPEPAVMEPILFKIEPPIATRRGRGRPKRKAPPPPQPARVTKPAPFNPSRRLPSTASNFNYCPECSWTGFKDAASLQKHMKTQHKRPFICVFHFAGCGETYASKNEWKRHVAAQHLNLNFWLCTKGQCGQDPDSDAKDEGRGDGDADGGGSGPTHGRPFKRKDLFTQHIRRMHLPNPVLVGTTGDAAQEAMVKDMQDEAFQKRCETPRFMTCPAEGCTRDFHGGNVWDERMEHVAVHLEAAANETEPPVEFGGPGDEALTEWASSKGVSVIRKTTNGWELCKPLRSIKVGLGNFPSYGDAAAEEE